MTLTFEKHPTILRDPEGANRNVDLAETGREIGEGSRAQVREVLVDDVPMARKSFKYPGGAERAFQGHGILRRNLPESELPHLAPMELELDHNAVILPRLNEHAWVISMGENVSVDRTELSQNRVPAIPNFNSAVTKLMDAVQDCGNRCLEIGPDVYFLTIDRDTYELGHIYADTESMTTGSSTGNDNDIPLFNVFWAAGAVQLFLQECVESPVAYSVRVRQEALHRMSGYDGSYELRRSLLETNELNWPGSSWQQKLGWGAELLRRQVISAWNS